MSDELEEFKQLVRETTKEYAVQHELCNVVDDYLADLGLAPVCKTKEITVRLAFQSDVKVHVNEEDWDAKTDEEKQALVMGSLYLDGRTYVPLYYQHDDAALVMGNGTSVLVELAGVLLDAKRDGAPVGYEPLFAGWDGTVRHYYPIERGGGAVLPLCENSSARAYPRASSSRDSGRICVRCSRKAEALNNA